MWRERERWQQIIIQQNEQNKTKQINYLIGREQIVCEQKWY